MENFKNLLIPTDRTSLEEAESEDKGDNLPITGCAWRQGFWGGWDLLWAPEASGCFLVDMPLQRHTTWGGVSGLAVVLIFKKMGWRVCANYRGNHAFQPLWDGLCQGARVSQTSHSGRTMRFSSRLRNVVLALYPLKNIWVGIVWEFVN